MSTRIAAAASSWNSGSGFVTSEDQRGQRRVPLLRRCQDASGRREEPRHGADQMSGAVSPSARAMARTSPSGSPAPRCGSTWLRMTSQCVAPTP